MSEGLCERCENRRTVTSTRGSTFVLCEAAKTEPGLPKYPRLPVLSCSWFREQSS